MRRYLARRIVALAGVWLAVSLLAFALGKMAPGDPVVLMLERQLGHPPTASDVARLRAELGLDRPLVVQYLGWLRKAVTGDLGRSFSDGRPVTEVLAERIPRTAALALTAAGLSLVLSLPTGMLAAARPGSWWDHGLRIICLLAASVPGYFAAYVLILLFGVLLRWFPVAGAGGPAHLVLPAVALALHPAAVQARLIRAAFLEVLGEDYIRTAHAKGVPLREILLKHALRNAALPLVTVLALQLGHLLLGSVVIEFVFGWPGLGLRVLDAVGQRDYPLLQGFVLLAGTVFVALNGLADVIYGLLDPRVRAGEGVGSA